MTDIRKLPFKRQGHTVYDVTGSDFCYCPAATATQAQDKAAFVITACNAHADLLAVCNAAHERLTQLGEQGIPVGGDLLSWLEDAIAQGDIQ